LPLTPEEALFAAALSNLRDAARTLCRTRNWSLRPLHRLGALTEEAAELNKAIRGKGGDVIEETGDVLFTALAMVPEEVSMYDVLQVNRDKRERLKTAPPYAGEDRDD
jgi:hypothetical protein